MAPFAVVAPIIGPLLDRFRYGRRLAIAASLVGRGILALVLGRAIASSNPLTLYPAAFGLLILSRAYGVSRSALMPRVLPPTTTLVQANARVTLAGTLAAAAFAPVAEGINQVVGADWTLRAALVVYVFGAVLAFRLPAHADSPVGEEALPPRARRPLPGLRGLPPTVARMLHPAMALRALSGFLLLFLAFLVRAHRLPGAPTVVELGLLAGAATGGGIVGTALGARIRRLRPETFAVASIGAATAAAVAATVFFSLVAVLALTVIAAAAQALSKLALDSVIQREVPEAVRTSTFARTETVLQLGWVVGGVIGVVLPRDGLAALILCCVALVPPFVSTLRYARIPSAGEPPRADRRRDRVGSGGPPGWVAGDAGPGPTRAAGG
jgi:MFS family permease